MLRHTQLAFVASCVPQEPRSLRRAPSPSARRVHWLCRGKVGRSRAAPALCAEGAERAQCALEKNTRPSLKRGGGGALGVQHGARRRRRGCQLQRDAPPARCCPANERRNSLVQPSRPRASLDSLNTLLLPR